MHNGWPKVHAAMRAENSDGITQGLRGRALNRAMAQRYRTKELVNDEWGLHNAAVPASIRCINRDFCDRQPVSAMAAPAHKDEAERGRASAIKAHDNAIIHGKDLPPLRPRCRVMRQLHCARNNVDDKIAALVKSRWNEQSRSMRIVLLGANVSRENGGLRSRFCSQCANKLRSKTDSMNV